MSRATLPFVRRCRVAAGLMLFAVSAASPAEAVEFPQNPQQWLNSPPLSMKQVAGKAVLLYFFNEQDEEECLPRWKEMQAMAKEYEDRPVLFLAVNSSAPRNVIDAYVKQVGLTWPVLLDSHRALEKACPVEKVTKDNSMQVAVINPNGTIAAGSWQNPQDTLKDALKYAKWTIDPAPLPDSLRPIWFQVEYQNYAAAAGPLKKALKSPKDDVKAGAEALLAAIGPVIAEKVAAAEAAFDAGEKWPAYRDYAELSEQFKGYDLPANVEARKKELLTDANVKAEVAAMKTFDAGKKQALNPAQKAKGLTVLKKLVKDKPDSAAAKLAEELIKELES